MYSTIIVPMALDHGISDSTLAIARRLLSDGGRIIALHVYEAPPASVKAYLDENLLQEATRAGNALLKEKIAGHEGVEPVLLKGHVGRSITDYADEIGADCIVMGSHQPGLTDYLLGSTAARVVRHAHCAVHVHRPR